MCCSRQDYNYRITVIVRCVSSILILDCCASKKQHSTAIIGLHPKQTPKWRLHCEEGCLWRCSWWRLAGVDRPLSSSSGWSTQEYHLTSTRRESALTRYVIETLISDLWCRVHHSLMIYVSIDLSASRTRSPVRTGQSSVFLLLPPPLSPLHLYPPPIQEPPLELAESALRRMSAERWGGWRHHLLWVGSMNLPSASTQGPWCEFETCQQGRP